MPVMRKLTSTNLANQRALAEVCVLNETLYRIGMRWKMQLLYSVQHGCHHFAAMKRALPNVSDHVLGRRLRELLEEGLVAKVSSGPRRHHYTVTPRGAELLAIMQLICRWELEPEAPAPGRERKRAVKGSVKGSFTRTSSGRGSPAHLR
jgi:DNA-binding HxlR family transcriptional regulator